MPQVDLYYSTSFLGHFTLIVFDRVDLIVYRVHFVDKDAEAAQGGNWIWLKHKAAQASGFATGLVLSDWKASPKEFQTRIQYQDVGRSLLRSWQIKVDQMDAMLNWVQTKVKDQNAGHFGSYGYVVYSGNVDNCGSFALKALNQAGIVVTLPTLKSWLQLPSLIKSDI
jgi:hypothetical protein